MASASTASSMPTPSPPWRRTRRSGGGRALEAARASEPAALIEVVEASGLRGRGGAGFPTGTSGAPSPGCGGDEPPTVVVNGAEGEPGTLKDRTLLRRNPYKVLEGALIAAHAVGADRVVVGMKRSATGRARRVQTAIEEVAVRRLGRRHRARACVAGSDRYLLGEETALLEVLDGQPAVPARWRRPTATACEPADGHAREQRRDPGQRPGHRARRPRGLPVAGHAGVARHDRVHGQRPHRASGRRRVRARHAAAAR